MTRRAWPLSLVLMPIAFLVGLLAGDRNARLDAPSAAPSTGATGEPAADAARAVALSPPPKPVRPKDPAPRGDSGPAATLAKTSEADSGNVVVLDGLHPSSIRVRVVDADGVPVEGARVRAIREGLGRLPDGVAEAQTDALGRARVRVPVEGRYAVIARSSGAVLAVREGVEATAEAAGEAVMTLGRTATLEVNLAGVPSGAHWRVTATAPAPRLSDGTTLDSDRWDNAEGSADSLTLTLPEGVPFSLTVYPDWEDPLWRGLAPATRWPRTVTAPGSFVVQVRRKDPSSAVTVDVEVGLEAEIGTLPASGRVEFTFVDHVGTSGGVASEDRVEWGPDDSELSVRHHVSEWPPGVAGSIEWTGAGLSGSVAVPPSRAGETLHLAAIARILPSAVETGIGSIEVLDEHGERVAAGDIGTRVDLFARNCEMGTVASRDDALLLVRDWLHASADQPVVATRGLWIVSRPGTAAAGESLRLRLEVGGYLLIHLRTPLPSDLRPLSVERADGAWLGTYGSDGELPEPAQEVDECPYTAGNVRNGTLIGPLPPGDVGLRFRIAGVEVGRATAHVVAREVTVLTVR